MSKNALNITKLSFSFSDKLIFKELDFALPENEISLLIGANGSGKTTLCRLISGLQNEFTGNIEKTDKLVYMQQFAEANLLAATPLADLAAWNMNFKSEISPSMSEKIIKALEWFSLENASNQPVWELSGGQQQRVALSALAMRNDHFWILDEPAAGLDELMQKKLIELIENHKKQGYGALIITHRLPLFDNSADRIYELKDNNCSRIK